MDPIVAPVGTSNREFLEQYAQAGRIGLAGGITLIDKVISGAERHVDANKRWSQWSHAFLFQGRRVDGQHWVIESDLDIHQKHIRLGVQENRLSKYYDESFYTTLAVIDPGCTEEQVSKLLNESLDLVSNHARYSMRELMGTLIALHRPKLRGRTNLLARESSFFCSAFVRHVFQQAGIDLTPGMDIKNTTPEDIFRTPIPHRTWLLPSRVPENKMTQMIRRARRGVHTRLTRLLDDHQESSRRIQQLRKLLR
jgi:hypothetical protein